MEDKHEHGGRDRRFATRMRKRSDRRRGASAATKATWNPPPSSACPSISAPVQQESSTARGPQNRSQKPNVLRTRLRDADLANSRAGTTRRQDTCIVGIAVLKANAVHALAFVPFR